MKRIGAPHPHPIGAHLARSEATPLHALTGGHPHAASVVHTELSPPSRPKGAVDGHKQAAVKAAATSVAGTPAAGQKKK